MEAEAYQEDYFQRDQQLNITGAEMLIKSLKEEGVEVIFGYPGGAVIPIYDALYDSGIKHILSRHEQGAVHAADGYARVTGKVGVCIATSGPGATNLVTGITNAFVDSIPLVAITGQVPSSLIGTNAFQEADITSITLPVTKKNYLVKSVEDLPSIIKEAFYIASNGRPGPVLIDIPKDISYEKAVLKSNESAPIRYKHPPLKEKDIEEVKEEILKAKRPLVIAGGGIIAGNAANELLSFIDKTQIPITTTLMGLGGVPASHPLWLGMPGMHGTVAANRAIQHADLLIALGVRFDDRVTGKIEKFAPKARIIHVDIDSYELGKNISTQLSINSDVRELLAKINQMKTVGDTKQWVKLIMAWKHQKPLVYQDSSKGLKPQYVIEKVSRFYEGNVIVTTDVGQHQMWTAQYFRIEKPRSFVTSGGLGTMGFGLPAAIGAQVAKPKANVVVISGDGSIQMNSQELATIRESNLPIKVIILNNSYLGMVRQWQEIFHQRRYSFTNMVAPNFVKLANAYGILGLRASTKEEVNQVLEQGLKHDGPAILEFIVEKEENVFPFVPAGAGLDEMIEKL